MHRVGIVIPVLKNFKGLAEFLTSIDGGPGIIWTPYIIPNWSENNCVAKSWNIGLKNAFEDLCDYAVVCNDDIVFCDHTLPRLISLYEQHEQEVGLLTPTNYRDADHGYSAEEVRHGFDPADMYDHFSFGGPDFACFVISERVYRKVGTFDENFTPAYFEDNDYTHRLLMAGYRPRSDSRVAYYHHGSVTQNFDAVNPACSSRQFEANRYYYMSKWGGMPGGENNKNPYMDSNYSYSDWRILPPESHIKVL